MWYFPFKSNDELLSLKRDFLNALCTPYLVAKAALVSALVMAKAASAMVPFH